MKINLWIDPKNEKRFGEDLRKFLNDHAKNLEEIIILPYSIDQKGKVVVQETSEFSKAWFYHIEREKKKDPIEVLHESMKDNEEILRGLSRTKVKEKKQ